MSAKSRNPAGVRREPMPVSASVLWKPLRDSHYVIASLQPGGGGLRQIFVRQAALREVQWLARLDPERPLAGLLLGERLDCSTTSTPYVVVESHSEVSLASADEAALADAIRVLQQRVAPGSLEVLGWYCRGFSADDVVSQAIARVHRSAFAEPWQTVLVFNEDGAAGGLFLLDTRAARWFHMPFYEMTGVDAARQAVQTTCIAWPAYVTAAPVDQEAEAPLRLSLTPLDALAAMPVAPPPRRRTFGFGRLDLAIWRAPGRTATNGATDPVAAPRADEKRREPTPSVGERATSVFRQALDGVVRLREERAAEAARRQAEADAARAKEEARQAKLVAERRAAREEAQRRAAEAEKRRAAEAEERRAAEAEARRLAAEEDERRRAAEAEQRRMADEEDTRRRAVEAEHRRLIEEENERRRAAEAKAEAEARRLAEEEAERRRVIEAEQARQAAEAEARRQAELAEIEAKRQAEAAAIEAKRQAEAAAIEAKRQAEAEAIEVKRRAAEAEAQRKAAEAAQRKAAEEARRRAVEEADRERQAAEAEARRLAMAEAAEAKRRAAESAVEAQRRAAEAEALRISLEVAALRERLVGPPIEGTRPRRAQLADVRSAPDHEDTTGSEDPYRYIAIAKREGFEVTEKFERGTWDKPETVWLLHERESGLRLVVVATDREVREASLHYNFHTDDVSLLETTAPEERDLESRTIYGREACLQHLRARCRQLRATGALERDWKVSPTI